LEGLFLGTYIARSNVEDQFGVNNIADWADLDRDEDATKITNRITTAISYAEALVEGKLRTSRYLVPFSNTSDPLIQSICAIYAGEFLYRSRGLRDLDETNKLIGVVARADDLLNMIIAGQIRLSATFSMSDGGPTAPEVIS